MSSEKDKRPLDEIREYLRLMQDSIHSLDKL